MNIIAITQARISSSRLPAKVIKKVMGEVTLLELHLRRLMRSKRLSRVVVATTEEQDAGLICDIAVRSGASCYRGELHNVLDRYYQAALLYKPDYIVRVTADCPLIDAEIIDTAIELALDKKVDYVSNSLERTFPDGLDVEVFTFGTLEKAWKEASLLSDKEHVTPYIWRNSSYKGGAIFTSVNLFCNENMGAFRLTVDEPADFEVIQHLVREVGPDKKWTAYTDFLKENPEVNSINNFIPCNEGYQRSLEKD